MPEKYFIMLGRHRYDDGLELTALGFEVATMESVAKLFQNGRSQAVRLPKEFRFKGTEVRIRKQGEKIILEPVKKSKWPDEFGDVFTQDPQFEIPEPLPSKKFKLD